MESAAVKLAKLNADYSAEIRNLNQQQKELADRHRQTLKDLHDSYSTLTSGGGAHGDNDDLQQELNSERSSRLQENTDYLSQLADLEKKH